ncbi:hypothetical protein HO173_012688 [Letharia columbiana]|uniref:Uncharacterized protein n=1 Tax=Letharia columbiana TaxID=112416 RepID=A0A8H6CMN0_9LECA|nr:uncharacterized protein HO173_012688 [Letharia columbiana]KAF6225916.1 hypothetical protein HO173_012688 [Letharia columbiana]
MSLHHHVLAIPGGADLPPEFHPILASNMAEEWQSRSPKPSPIHDKTDTFIQPPSEKASTYTYAYCILRESLNDREATTEDFNAFLSIAAPMRSQKRGYCIFVPSSSLTHLAQRFSLTRRSNSKGKSCNTPPS